MERCELLKLMLYIQWLIGLILINYLKKIIFPPLYIYNGPIYSNSWFSGYIDTDGSFNIKGFTTENSYPGIQFYLCQREIDKSGESFRPLFEIISTFLQSSLILRKVNGFNQFSITTPGSQGWFYSY